MTSRLDVLCVGNAIVDVFAHCEDSFLQEHGIGKGLMNLTDAERSAALHAAVSDAREMSGGSAANTAVGIASLGGAAGFAGRVHDDALGREFIADIERAGVAFGAPPQKEGSPTASSIILVTPDAVRSMNTYLGACIEFQPGDIRPDEVAASKVIYLEGYLFDAPAGPQIFEQAVRLAGEHGVRISLSLSDPWCAERHREALSRFTRDHVDILFANEEEAESLCGTEVGKAAEHLRTQVDEAIVTRGERGALVCRGDEGHEIDARPAGKVVDTTGAGDLFAAGYLYGRTNGRDVRDSGMIASLAAGEVISHIGARPNSDIAALVRRHAL